MIAFTGEFRVLGADRVDGKVMLFKLEGDPMAEIGQATGVYSASKEFIAKAHVTAESYATIENGELMLVNSYIPEYLQANRFNHEPKRPRKLLASKKQIARFAQAIEREGMTLIPLKVYFNEKGRAKIEVAIARGKKLHDKRESEKERDWKREQGRLLRDRG